MNPILNQLVEAAWGTPGSRKPKPPPPPPPPTASPGLVGLTPHLEQRLGQMQSVAPFLGPEFELMLERHGVSNPAAAYKVVANAFANHASTQGKNPRALLQQLLAAKRSGKPPVQANPYGA